MNNSLLESTRNTRELGGYMVPSGTTKKNAFWRSDKPVALTQKDIETLRKAGVTTVVDLRNDREVTNQLHSLAHVEGFTYMHCPMYGNGAVPSKPEDVAQSYFDMVNASPKHIAAIFKAMANAESGVLFNCAEGKDRTGATAALLLLLADVNSEDIVENYYATKHHLKDLFDEWHKGYKYPMDVVVPQRQFMADFLKMFHETYPNVREYFLQIGLTDAEIDRLKSKLI